MIEAADVWRCLASVALALLAAAAIVAPEWAPHHPDAVPDPAAGRHRPPGTTLWKVTLADGRTLLADRVETDGSELRVHRLGTELHLRQRQLADGGAPRAHRFVLGSDRLGRDLLSRLLHGLRLSLLVALSSMLLALILGTVVGLGATVAGARLEAATMHLVDVLLAVPKLFLVLAVAATVPVDAATLVVVLAATTWMSTARLVRAEARSVAARELTTAARAVGVAPLRLALRHLLPHLSASLRVQAVLRVASLILLESSVSFLGAGLAPPTPTLGGMLAEALEVPAAPWWSIVLPGLALVLPTVACLYAAELLGGGRRRTRSQGQPWVSV